MNNKTDILYNKKIALAAVSFMVIFACLFGTWRPLHKMRKEALAVFWETGKDGVSINEDLETKAAYADNLVVLAKKYNIDYNYLETIIKNLKDGATPSQKLLYNRELNAAISEIDKSFLVYTGNPPMSDIDKKAYNSAYTRIISQEDIIKRNLDEYITAVEYYNHELRGFPANVFGSLVNLKPLDIEL